MTISYAVNDDQFSDAVVTTANDLAEAYNDELVVLHSMTQERFDIRSERQPEYYVDEGANDAANTAKTIASRTLEDAGRVIAKGQVGDPAEEIIESTERLEPRYLVLGGRKDRRSERRCSGVSRSRFSSRSARQLSRLCVTDVCAVRVGTSRINAPRSVSTSLLR
ncbi:universal stress protein [Natrinema salifodinae]|uniref:Universal stress protein family protein n=1 Tax=Natrinema salifodinae TaxID=1202768 RepID=A0A1I0LXE9_9EURY|nr:Universal stress protein family protein [Natrinema salifodinae]